MANYMIRILIGIVYYCIGVFWACVTVPVILLRAVFGGWNGISKLWRRNKHDVLPEIARKNFQHDYVRTKSGIRFHYVHAGSENNPLMICLHGFPECWYSWRHILQKFSSKYHVVAIDMRGYGDSDKPSSIGEYHMDYLVNDVQEIITSLGYERAVIVAHDLGGIVAWQLPHFFPHVVDKLILMNAPHPDGYQEFMMSHMSQFIKSWYVFLFQIPFIAEFLVKNDDYKMIESAFNGRKSGIQNRANKLTPDEVEIYKHCAGRNSHYGINYYRAVNPIYRGMRLQRVSNQIVQPTLLIWGNKTSALDIGLVSYCKKYVKNLTLHIVDGASHWVAQDQPEQVHDAMEKFLDDND